MTIHLSKEAVEAVAKAIFEAASKDCLTIVAPWEEQDQRHFCKQAEAAITAFLSVLGDKAGPCRGREAALEEAKDIATAAVEHWQETAKAHPSGSPSRDRCHARARAAADIEQGIENLKSSPEGQADHCRGLLEQAAIIAVEGCLVPPDGGSPSEAERLMCEEIARRIRALASRSDLSDPAPVPSGWRTDMENAPHMKTILLWAATDVAEDGTIKNWKMATGFYHEGWTGCGEQKDYSPWNWEGRHVAPWEHLPTHWQELPAAPVHLGKEG